MSPLLTSLSSPLRWGVLLLLLGCTAGETRQSVEETANPIAEQKADVPAPKDAPEPRAVEEPEQEPVPEPELPPPSATYMGREIAQTMHWRGADWLLRETREDEEHVTLLLDNLGLEEGMAVCDLGCGNGYHALRIASRVGPEGVVYGVDVQPQMLSMLRRRAERAGLDNIERIVGTVADPRLEANTCDLILLVDVYHELSYPEQMLQALRRALRPGGRVALVEFRAEDPDVPIKPLHKMSKAQIRREWEANGFEILSEYDELPWQHLVFLGRTGDR
ncbi:MAG: class I SAM-dependent methyltransferase [Planctomycetota bacterium]